MSSTFVYMLGAQQWFCRHVNSRQMGQFLDAATPLGASQRQLIHLSMSSAFVFMLGAQHTGSAHGFLPWISCHAPANEGSHITRMPYDINDGILVHCKQETVLVSSLIPD